MTEEINKAHYHFIGIGGIGMSGLATMLLSRNAKVSGSDMSLSYNTDRLKSIGANIAIGHSEGNVPAHATHVIYNSNIPTHNVEYAIAKKRGQKLLHRSNLLAAMMTAQRPLLVTGTHGKTSTTALLIAALQKAGSHPSYAVGGVLPGEDSNAAMGRGDLFVAEADESDGTHLNYSPYGAIVTNIDSDHLDHYGTIDNIIETMALFMGKVKDGRLLLWCGDDSRLRTVAPKAATSYGFAPTNDWQITAYRQKGFVCYFSLKYRESHFKEITLAATGRHQAANAAAVFALCHNLGVNEEAVRAAFSSFAGVARRCQHVGTNSGITVFDDYAHHPAEVKATLEGLRSSIGHQRCLYAVFQPHRYSRMQQLMDAFDGAFDAADLVIITDLYSAGEKPIKGVDALTLEKRLRCRSKAKTLYLPTSHIRSTIAAYATPGDCIVTMGAGDIHLLAKKIANRGE